MECFHLSINLVLSRLPFKVCFCREAGSAPQREGHKVLVAESSLSLRNMLENTLTEVGYRVVSVSDGEQALAMYRRERPALVVMDLEMPDPGGLEAIASIVEEDHEARFLVLASFDRRDEVVTAETLGASDYLTKPLNSSRLLESVAKALRKPNS